MNLRRDSRRDELFEITLEIVRKRESAQSARLDATSSTHKSARARKCACTRSWQVADEGQRGEGRELPGRMESFVRACAKWNFTFRSPPRLVGSPFFSSLSLSLSRFFFFYLSLPALSLKEDERKKKRFIFLIAVSDETLGPVDERVAITGAA